MKELFQEAYSLVIFLFVTIISALIWREVSPEVTFVDKEWFPHLLNTLLAIGFYASVRSISTSGFKKDFGSIVSFISVGVFVKTLLVGTFFYLITGELFGFALGIIVAQIDPLSVPAVLTEQARLLSQKGKNLLLSWASFDSPISALFTLLCIQLVFPANAHWAESLVLLSMNALMPLIIYGLLKTPLRNSNAFQVILLAIVFVIAIKFELLLGLAVTALLLRPHIYFSLDRLVAGAYVVSLVLLGYFVAMEINVLYAIPVAALVMLAQFCTVNILSKKVDASDKRYLQFAQQNGVTAIVLAIYFEQFLPGITSIIAPTIVLVNVAHLVVYTHLNRLSSVEA